MHDEAQTRVEGEKFERREAGRVAKPKLSGPIKFAVFLSGLLSGLVTFLIIIGMIGVLIDQNDADFTDVGSKVGIIILLCVPAFGFGWIAYKCSRALQRLV